MSSDEFKFDANLIKLVQGLGQNKDRFIILQGIINSNKSNVTTKDLEALTGFTLTTLNRQLSELVLSGIIIKTEGDEKNPTHYEISGVGRKLIDAIGSVV